MRQATLDKLRRQCEQARYEMQRHPADWAGTWEDLFSGTPEGDFKWNGKDYVADSDNIPYETDNDEEDGAAWSWNCHSMSLGRKNGREWVEFHTLWACGEFDTEGPYYKEDAADSEFVYRMMTQNCCYSLLKMHLYSIWCAETGKDPLENCMLFDVYRAASRQVTCYVQYTPTVAGYRAEKSRINGKAWQPGLDGLPEVLQGIFDAEVVKTDESHLYEIYTNLLAGKETTTVGAHGVGGEWQCLIESSNPRTLKITGKVPGEPKDEAIARAIKEISSRRLVEEVKSTLDSIKKWRKPQEATSEQG